MKTKKLNARASAYANSVEPEDNKNNDACWMAARRGYIAGWKERKEKGKKCEDGGWHVSAIFVDDMIEPEPQSLKPEDLEDGEIYVDEGNENTKKCGGYPRIIRFKRSGNNGLKLYSQLCSDGDYFTNAGCYQSETPIRPATLPEKLKLIEQELRHGYDHSKK